MQGGIEPDADASIVCFVEDDDVKPRGWRWKRGLLIGGPVLTLIVILIVVFVLPTATGYVAKLACSGVFVGGHPRERLEAEEFATIPYVSFDVDDSAGRVHAHVLGLAGRTAVHRQGLGCALAIDVDPDELQRQGSAMPRAEPSDEPWPQGDGEDPRPDPPGLDREALERVLDEAFTEPDPYRPRWTRAVVIVHEGRLVAERYASWTSASTPLLGWSMSKSVTNALVGGLVLRGELDVFEPAPIPAWEDGPRREITIDALLRMSSGLEFEERYGPLADATRMLFEVDDAAAVPISKPLEHEIDTFFAYSSGTSNILSWIVRERFTTLTEYHQYPHEGLFVPLGMRTAVFETDASGTFVGSSFVYASARDWARFGQLYLQDGVWNGERLLPEGWAKYSGTATPTAPLGDYAAHFWANAGKPDAPADRRLPSVPTDAFQASGFQGQAVLIVPSRDAVIVRLGLTHDRDAWDLDAFASAVLDALPTSQ